jgi:heptosyltransferase II
MAEIACRFFNGYKPCGKANSCDRTICTSYSSVDERILIIHLEALGAVLRSTSLIPAIRRKFPRAHITWVTKRPAQDLLTGIGIDRLITADFFQVAALKFDFVFVIDKSLEASGILALTRATEVRGFRADAVTGAILPANPEAHELWELGLDDHRKFFVNKKSEQRLVHEALGLGEYLRDEYQAILSSSELATAQARRRDWSPSGGPLIGLNTGCAAVLPAKKLSIEGHRALIARIAGDPALKHAAIVLLGGPEDTERNRLIAKDLPVIQSPTQSGLRDGFASIAACDAVVSGDSLGMHMSIALKKWTVAWFGPTCAHEIDLYGRGVKVQTSATCSPCWKRVCEQKLMCYDQVDFHSIVQGIKEGLPWLNISSSKPPSPETSFSPSP